MNKIKILVLSGDNDGVGYYRVLNPHLTLNDPEIEVDIRLVTDATIPLMDENFMAQYQILFYNKILPIRPEAKEQFLQMLKRLNIKIVYDIDDYWVLNDTHLNYRNWKKNNSAAVVEKTLKEVDWVVTTTPLFADKIRKVNPQVQVMENAVNLKEQQWISQKVPSEKIRFLWGGGISHMPDLRLLKDDFKKFDKDFLAKAQVYLCGFDMRIRMTDGKIMKDDPRRSQWGHFEALFTNNNKYVRSAEYNQFLIKADKTDFGYREEFKDEFYQRRWTKAILEYGTMYNEADICLAPLKGERHQFNYCKSQLKVIESGAHFCPLICSHYGPYTIDDIEGKKDGIRKGFLVEGKDGWYEKMKWYSENPQAVKDHGQALHEYVKANYEINVVNQKRAAFYKEIVKE
jgi:glycosyltransferase involved in cell wall biosynthesis